MRFIDLCAGIGGFSLGLTAAGMTCIAQVEIDDYCTRILKRHWPRVPKWGDIKTIDPAELPAADLVCGGYPCQPFSSAGKRRGAGDDRHIWPYISAILRHVNPAWALFENVAGHLTLGLDDVLSDLEGLGYAAQALIIPACAVDAPHRRDRVWIIAHAKMCSGNGGSIAESSKNKGKRQGATGGRDCAETAANTDNQRQLQPQGGIERQRRWRKIEPGMAGMVHGLPPQVDRIKALGNAVVPQVVHEIGRAIMAAHYGEAV